MHSRTFIILYSMKYSRQDNLGEISTSPAMEQLHLFLPRLGLNFDNHFCQKKSCKKIENLARFNGNFIIKFTINFLDLRDSMKIDAYQEISFL